MIEVAQRDGVACLILRHGKANPLDIEFCQAVLRELEEVEKSPARAVVLTSEGTIFSAGLNLIRILEEDSGYVRRFFPVLKNFFQRIFLFPKPVVAAINGHAVAGGFILASLADVRLMAQGEGRMGLPEFMAGIPFPPTPLEAVRFAVPRRYFTEVLYGGAVYPPLEADRRGLVDRIAEPDRLLEEANRCASKLGEISPPVFRRIKRRLRGPVLETMRQRERERGAMVDAVWSSRGTRAVLRRYVARTLNQAP